MNKHNNTLASTLSSEDIKKFIEEYFENINKFKGNYKIIASMRELLYEAKRRKLYTDAQIRIMGARIR